MSKKSEKQAERDEAVERLREWVKPGDRLTFVCTYHSSRGYSTHGYRVLLAVAADEPSAGAPAYRTRPWIADVTYMVGKATGTWNERAEEIRVTGCGFDKRFEVTDTLSRLLGEAFSGEGRIG
jgi:prophage tail gpP-like protein